jgi:hypothetical protein
VQNFFGAVNDYLSSGFADVFDFVQKHFGAAWSYAVDAFHAGSDEGG